MLEYLSRGKIKALGGLLLVIAFGIGIFNAAVVGNSEQKKNTAVSAPTQNISGEIKLEQHEIINDEIEMPVLTASEALAKKYPAETVFKSKGTKQATQLASRGNVTVSLKVKLMSSYGLDASQVNVSDEELYLLAKMIECESRWEPYEGKIAVGVVILNRVKVGRFPNTIKSVIFQKGQFSPITDGAWQKMEPGVDSYKAAIEALTGTNLINGVSLENALFFIYDKLASDNGRDWFKNNLKFVTKIGNHDFYSY